jgi:hypothetical protein
VKPIAEVEEAINLESGRTAEADVESELIRTMQDLVVTFTGNAEDVVASWVSLDRTHTVRTLAKRQTALRNAPVRTVSSRTRKLEVSSRLAVIHADPFSEVLSRLAGSCSALFSQRCARLER